MASACGLPLISKVMTSIGLSRQLYGNAKMSNLNFVVQMSKEFSISSSFEPIDIITLHTICWPQLHSTYHRPQVSFICFMRFLWVYLAAKNMAKLLSLTYVIMIALHIRIFVALKYSMCFSP